MILLPAANEQGEASGLETFGQRLLFIKIMLLLTESSCLKINRFFNKLFFLNNYMTF